jgi:hypothetical protein
MHWAMEFINTMWNLIFKVHKQACLGDKSMRKVLSAYGGTIRSGGNDGIEVLLPITGLANYPSSTETPPLVL